MKRRIPDIIYQTMNSQPLPQSVLESYTTLAHTIRDNGPILDITNSDSLLSELFRIPIRRAIHDDLHWHAISWWLAENYEIESVVCGRRPDRAVFRSSAREASKRTINLERSVCIRVADVAVGKQSGFEHVERRGGGEIAASHVVFELDSARSLKGSVGFPAEPRRAGDRGVCG